MTCFTDGLTDQTAAKCLLFRNECKSAGIGVVVYSTSRTLTEQAERYVVGRSYLQIKSKAYSLRKAGYGYLASILESADRGAGSTILTHLCCGESFHHIGEAFDAYPIKISDESGVPVKIVSCNEDDWKTMALAAEKCGLYCGYNNKKQDPTHFQLRPQTNMLRVYSPERLKEILIKNDLLYDEQSNKK